MPAGGFVPDISRFARAVVWLQERRHTADYDPGPRFRTDDAHDAIEIARSAQKEWQTAPSEQKEALLWLLLFRPRP